MPANLIQSLSPTELNRKISALMQRDSRILPEKAKIFAAVASLQQFDRLPEIASPAQITTLIENGCMELHRGLSPSDGISADLYARELIKGTLHPGTKIAHGHGIYFSTPSIDSHYPDFPRLSVTAQHYAHSPLGSGILIRCVLKNGIPLVEREDIFEHFREERNRARRAGITDLGSFAAACGHQGYLCDGIAPEPREQTVVILDRTSLVFQKVALQISQIEG